MFVVDIIILLLITLSIFLGYKKGLIIAVVGIFTFIVSIIISFILFEPIANFIINNTYIDENITSSIVQKYLDDESNTNNEKTEGLVQSYMKKYTEEIKGKGVNFVGNRIAIIIIKIGVFIGMFLILRISLIFVKLISKLIEKIPIIKQTNKLGGMIYGLIRGLLIIYICLTIILLCEPVLQSSIIISNINKSILGKFLYENNLLVQIFFL